MPYWIYSFENQGKITFRGSESHQEGDYLITKHYNIVSEIEASYEGISYDAAASMQISAMWTATCTKTTPVNWRPRTASAN